MITTTDFGTLCDGRTVRLYTLKNDAIELSVTDYGSTLVRLLVPDKNGKPTDVVLGYDDLAGYVADDSGTRNTILSERIVQYYDQYQSEQKPEMEQLKLVV